jgi:hypothetical protein
MTPKNNPLRLESLEGRQVAVELTVVGRTVVCHGKACYEVHPSLGRVLRISLEDAEGQEIIISEAEFQGSVRVDGSCGCQYLLKLD